MATVEIMPTPASARLHQWLVIAALAAGLIGMHHLIGEPTASHGGAHQHTMAAAEAPSVATGNDAPAPTSESVSPTGCPGMGGMMGHLCLAVLTAADPLIPAITIRTVAPALRDPLRPRNRGSNPILARAPPTSAERLAQLGVCRC
jgi:hypothetical protein